MVFPHPKQSFRKVHRLVILPDYQGIGLGKLLLNNIYKHIKNDYPLSITTSNPALVQSLKNDDNWICIRHSRSDGNNNIKSISKSKSSKRITTSFVYKG